MLSEVAHPEWALCLGGADCVWEDVKAWEALYGRPWDGLVIAANDVGCHWPRALHHWVSLHPDKLERWMQLRAAQQLSPLEGECWGRIRKSAVKVPYQCVEPWPGGSSGMLAVQVAQVVGCTRAILCGIPLTASPHFGETHEQFHKSWLAANGHWKAWPKQKDKMEGWVRSMSGRTKDLLGAPTLLWLQGQEEVPSV